MNFEDKLIILRKKEGMSQEQLADRLGVTRQSVSKWESGATLPERLINIERYFRGYEYVSRTKIGGIPLVCIRFNANRSNVVAKGIIAIGNIAVGVVALGGISIGIFSMGGIAFGVAALGGLAAGIGAFGGVAIGVLALGASAIGVYAGAAWITILSGNNQRDRGSISIAVSSEPVDTAGAAVLLARKYHIIVGYMGGCPE